MDSIDKIAIAFVVGMILVLVGAFALYMRTSYRSGGWKRVKRDLIVAIIVIAGFLILRIIQKGVLPWVMSRLTR